MAASPLPHDPTFHQIRLRVADQDVVWLRAILEAYEGLASFYGDGTGTIVLTTPPSRAQELESLIAALATEANLQKL